MRFAKLTRAAVGLSLCLGLWVSAAGGAQEEPHGLMLKSMIQTMLQSRVEARVAERLAMNQAILSGVILDAELQMGNLTPVGTGPSAEAEQVRSRAELCGVAIGTVLAEGLNAYGEEGATPLMTSMMGATRAGMSLQSASETIRALIQSGYSVRQVAQVMQHVRERLRQEIPRDAGEGIGQQVRTMAKNRMNVQAMTEAIDGDSKGHAIGAGTQGSPRSNVPSETGSGHGSGNGSGKGSGKGGN